MPALGEDEVSRQCAAIPAWQVVDGVKITREFRFKDSREANYALNLVAAMAEEQGHHPAILLAYNKLRFTLTTHAAGGLTRNDFVMARIIDEILS
ncbi:MAG: 4a-hydroxytetrahydrobiopterin dehydratase [Candidatus Aureabacteria bacterium]|nr:4a-hydroxytetrahydrobiopterin dehydratase [Candidatus Auribacterota bacterium]